jgi:multicomponent Na+:H+ antiporter subunit B
LNSIILRIAARHLTVVLLLASLILLYRGHNLPGGGFIGGLLAATAIALRTMAGGVNEARGLLRVDPRTLVSGGLLVALASGLPAVFMGRSLLEGLWLDVQLPLIGAFPLGTPLLFDIGVYLTVIGFTLTIFFTLAETLEEMGD